MKHFPELLNLYRDFYFCTLNSENLLRQFTNAPKLKSLKNFDCTKKGEQSLWKLFYIVWVASLQTSLRTFLNSARRELKQDKVVSTGLVLYNPYKMRNRPNKNFIRVWLQNNLDALGSDITVNVTYSFDIQIVKMRYILYLPQ